MDNSVDSDNSEVIPFPDLAREKKLEELSNKLSDETMDNEQSKIYVKSFSKNEEGRKIWDKKHYCVYCNKAFAKLPRHLESKHPGEKEIIKLMSFDRRVKEQGEARLKLIEKIRKRGDYNHNVKVLETGEGEVVTKKSLTKAKTKEEYLPCNYCLGFYLKHDLYRHVSTCALREEAIPKGTRHQSNSVFLLPSTASQTSALDFQHDVLADMTVDEVSLCARNDHLIISFGEKQYQKHKALSHMRQYVRTKMRELARFLIKAREEENSIQTLSDCISPAKFKTTVRAVRSLCGIDTGKSATIPSLALKIGHSLSKCANILLSQALMQDDVELQNRSENFKKLYTMEWNNEVSATALKCIEANKWNKPKMLPLTNDVVKLQKHLDKQIEISTSQLEKNHSEGWRPLCEALLVSIILFNRRRSGEVERLTLDVYRQKNTSNAESDVSECLTSFEKHLVSSMTRVEIRGKRGRKVPVLLLGTVENAIDLLNKTREAAGIEKANHFVFANNTYGHLRGADCLRSSALAAALEHPDTMRSTNLRKHIATLSQVINLKDNELDILAQFLGHDMRVHRDFYRLPEDTLQMAKVGKLLMAMNKGTLKTFAGKSLDDITVNEEGK